MFLKIIWFSARCLFTLDLKLTPVVGGGKDEGRKVIPGLRSAYQEQGNKPLRIYIWYVNFAKVSDDDLQFYDKCG